MTHPETCPSTFLSSLPSSFISPSLFLLDFVLFGACFDFFFITNLLDSEVTVGAGLGRGCRWLWSWESVYLKALSSLSVSPFFFHSFPYPPPWLEGASASPKALGVGAVSNPPQPALGGGTSAHWPASPLLFLLGSLITD